MSSHGCIFLIFFFSFNFRQLQEQRQKELERERLERERLERERLERERLEQEQLERDRQERERQDRLDRLERERQERERLERLDRERQERERQEQLEREQLEWERERRMSNAGKFARHAAALSSWARMVGEVWRSRGLEYFTLEMLGIKQYDRERLKYAAIATSTFSYFSLLLLLLGDLKKALGNSYSGILILLAP